MSFKTYVFHGPESDSSQNLSLLKGLYSLSLMNIEKANLLTHFMLLISFCTP